MQSGHEANKARRLATETIKSTALALESVNNVERCNSLALGVLSIGDSIADNALEEGLQDTASLLVDHCGDVLDMLI